MTLAELDKTIKIGRKLQILSVVCASSYKETKAIATLKPDIMVCEPTELIGTGETSNDEYMQTTQRIIRETSLHTLVLQAASIISTEMFTMHSKMVQTAQEEPVVLSVLILTKCSML